MNRCARALKLTGLIVRRARVPATVEDADPHERKSAHGHLMRGAFGALLTIVRTGPEGSRNRFGRPLDEGLPQKGGTGQTPMYPGFVPATLGSRRDSLRSLKW